MANVDELLGIKKQVEEKIGEEERSVVSTLAPDKEAVDLIEGKDEVLVDDEVVVPKEVFVRIMKEREEAKETIKLMAMDKKKKERLEAEQENRELQQKASRTSLINFSNPLTTYFFRNIVYMSIIMSLVILINLVVFLVAPIPYLHWTQLIVISNTIWGFGIIIAFMDYRKLTMMMGMNVYSEEEEEGM